MVAVRGSDHGCVIVAYVLAQDELGAVGENDVIFGEAFFYGGGG